MQSSPIIQPKAQLTAPYRTGDTCIMYYYGVICTHSVIYCIHVLAGLPPEPGRDVGKDSEYSGRGGGSRPTDPRLVGRGAPSAGVL